MVDPQRDIIDHRKRSKPLGEATQFNGRKSISSPYRAVVGRLIYRWINISTNAGAPKRLRRLFVIARSEATKQSRPARVHGLLVRQESWRCPAGERPVRVSRSGRPVASVAWSPATAGAKRTQRLCGVCH